MLISNNDKTTCFARINENECNALAKKECKKCRFYKHRDKIKNNPYYAYSFKDKDKHRRVVEKYGIKDSQIIWE